MRIKIDLDIQEVNWASDLHTKSPLPPFTILYGGLKYNVNIVDTLERLEKMLDLFDALPRKTIAFDTETKGIFGDLVGISFAVNHKDSFYIPIGHASGSQIPVLTLIEKLKIYMENPEFTWLMHNSVYDIHILLNYGIEIPDYKYHDSMVLAWLMEENYPKSLKDRCEIELGLTATQHFDELLKNWFSKKERADMKKQNITVYERVGELPITMVGFYACQDVILTYKLWDKLLTMPEFKQFKRYYLHIERPICKIAALMNWRGLKIDVEAINKVKEAVRAEIDECTEKLFYLCSFNKETGEYEAYRDEDGVWHNLFEFNLQSPKQLKEVFIDKLGWPVVAKTKKGAASFDAKKALPRYKSLGFEAAEYLIRLSKARKVDQAYTTALLEAKDRNNRIHPQFKPIGAANTGRWSCSNPNFQSMPKKFGIRDVFITESDRCFVVCDFSQIELRVAADYAQDPNMMQAFQDGIDLHAKNATEIRRKLVPYRLNQLKENLGKQAPGSDEHRLVEIEIQQLEADIEKYPLSIDIGDRITELKKLVKDTTLRPSQLKHYEDELKRWEDERGRAKTTAFGINYGAGEREDIGITKEYLQMYLESNCGFKSYSDDHKLFVQYYGYTRTLMGRKRRVYEARSNIPQWQLESLYRKAFSTHVQGTAADIMKLAIVRMYEWFKGELTRQLAEWDIDAWIVGSVHDEVLVECKVEDAEKVAQIVQECMTYPMRGNKAMPQIQELDVPLEADPGIGPTWGKAKG